MLLKWAEAGSHIGVSASRVPHTDYIEQYRYFVSGKTCYISRIDNEETAEGPQYNKVLRIAYKAANPASALIIHGQTLQDDARESIAFGLWLGLGGSFVVYMAYLFSRLMKRLRKLA
jgi:hypothetical protein